MPPAITRTGPGKLTLGESSGTDFSVQVTSITLTANAGDPLRVLSGESIKDYTATLAITFLQDLRANGIAAYSFANAGATVAFEFTPNTAAGAKLAGRVEIDPLPIGGGVGEIQTAEASWNCPELPAFTPGTAAGD